jgi:hypothetical protein
VEISISFLKEIYEFSLLFSVVNAEHARKEK